MTDRVTIPGLAPHQIIASAKLARALKDFLAAHGIKIPDEMVMAIGQGQIDTEARVLAIEYDFVIPPIINEDYD